MPPDLIEDFASPDADPLDAHTIDFDWDALYALLDETERDLAADGWHVQAEAWRRIAVFVLGRSLHVPAIGRRFLALAWVVDPDLVGGESLSKLAARLKLSRPRLCRETARFSRWSGIRNRPQRHAGNWKP